MNGVEFNEDNELLQRSRHTLVHQDQRLAASFLVRIGFAKTEQEAIIMMVVTILVILGGLTFVMKSRQPDLFITTSDGRKMSAETYLLSVERGINPLIIKK